MKALDRISELIKCTGSALPSRSSSSKQSDNSVSPHEPSEQAKSTSTASLTIKDKDAASLEASKLCAVFTQATAILEKTLEATDIDTSTVTSSREELTKRVGEATALLPRCAILMVSLLDIGSSSDVDEDDKAKEELLRVKSKVERNLERLRRPGVKLLDGLLQGKGKGSTAGQERECVQMMLEGIVGVYEACEVRLDAIYATKDII